MKISKDKSKFASYYRAIEYLESLGNIGGGYQKTDLKSHPRLEMYLERTQDFLDLLGNPERGSKYIHITGTAGKGSVAATVHSELVKAGKRSGLFTSPFTVSTIEKIQVGDKYIDPLVFADITESIKPQIDEMIKRGRHGAPSYFEMMLAIAFIYFEKEECEYVVLEVGLGGRYDATNIIKDPLVTAITNISLDHTQILGSRTSDIALDKAGIIKKDSQFFTTEADGRILEIFQTACEEVGAGFHPIRVVGLKYDARNRILAGHICLSLGIVRSVGEVGESPSLPARFEIMERQPLVAIDGAHNPSKIESTIQNLTGMKYENLVLVIAISADKDWKKMLHMVVPLASAIYVTRFSTPNRSPVEPELLFEEAGRYASDKCSVYLNPDPVKAFREAREILTRDDALLVVGSFYLAGDIRALYCSEEKILEQRNSCIMEVSHAR